MIGRLSLRSSSERRGRTWARAMPTTTSSASPSHTTSAPGTGSSRRTADSGCSENPWTHSALLVRQTNWVQGRWGLNGTLPFLIFFRGPMDAFYPIGKAISKEYLTTTQIVLLEPIQIIFFQQNYGGPLEIFTNPTINFQFNPLFIRKCPNEIFT